jgi:hypothetical protein
MNIDRTGRWEDWIPRNVGWRLALIMLSKAMSVYEAIMNIFSYAVP